MKPTATAMEKALQELDKRVEDSTAWPDCGIDCGMAPDEIPCTPCYHKAVIAISDAAITEAVEEERRKLTHPKLVDDDGPLQVLVEYAKARGHSGSDAGGCEYCHAVGLIEEYLRHPTEQGGDHVE